MEKSFLNRRMFFAVLTLFVFVFAIQMADPASAAKWKKIDKGKKTVTVEGILQKYKWKSYKKNNNKVKVIFTSNYGTQTLFLTKKGKYVYANYAGYRWFVAIPTKLNAVKYYKKYFKKEVGHTFS